MCVQLDWLPDKEAGHSVLVINVAKATRDFYGEDLDEFGEAVVSRVEAAMVDRLSDAPGEAEQMVVIANCGVASSKQVRAVSLTYLAGFVCGP